MSPEVFPENGIIGFADLPALDADACYRSWTNWIDQGALTMNLRSFEKVNLSAASIRSNTSSESLMLFTRSYQFLIPRESATGFQQMAECGTHAAKRSGRSK